METGTYLLAAIEEKCERVHAIANGIANEGKPAENDGRFIGVLEEKLPQDIENYRYGHKGKNSCHNKDPNRLSRAALAELIQQTRQETHSGGRVITADRSGGMKSTERTKKDTLQNTKVRLRSPLPSCREGRDRGINKPRGIRVRRYGAPHQNLT